MQSGSGLTQQTGLTRRELIHRGAGLGIALAGLQVSGLARAANEPVSVGVVVVREGDFVTARVEITNNTRERVAGFDLAVSMPPGSTVVATSPAAVVGASTVWWTQPAGIDPGRTFSGYQCRFRGGEGTVSAEVKYWGAVSGTASSGPVAVPGTLADSAAQSPPAVTSVGGLFPYEAAVPKATEIQGWIEEICAKGHRSPGTPNDLWVEQYGKQKFEGLGIETTLQPCPPFDSWIPGNSALKITSGQTTLELEVCPMVYIREATSVTAPIVRYKTDKDLERAPGSIVIMDYPLNTKAEFSHILGVDYLHDPDKNIFESIHVNPMPDQSRAIGLVARIAQRKPVAIVAVLANYFESAHIYGVAGSAQNLGGIVGVWMSPGSGKKIDALEGADGARGTLNVQVTSQADVVTHNVVGMLPGATEHIVVYDSHHDAPFMGATEDTAGIACVLAQASYWAKVPKNERPFTFVFVWSSAHMKGAVGVRAFVANNKELVDKAMLAVAIETPGMDYGVENNKLVDLKRPEPRLFQVSHVPAMQQALFEAIKGEDLRRSMIVPTDIRLGRLTGEGYHFHDAGVPVIAHLSAPSYYMDKQDTPDKTDQKGMWQMTRALVRTVWAVKGQTPASMRGPDTQWRNRGGPSTSDVVRDILNTFDKDGNGSIDEAERADVIDYIKKNVYK